MFIKVIGFKFVLYLITKQNKKMKKSLIYSLGIILPLLGIEREGIALPIYDYGYDYNFGLKQLKAM